MVQEFQEIKAECREYRQEVGGKSDEESKKRKLEMLVLCCSSLVLPLPPSQVQSKSS